MYQDILSNPQTWLRSRLFYTIAGVLTLLLLVSSTTSFRDTTTGLSPFSHSRQFVMTPEQRLPHRERNAPPAPVHLAGVKSKYAFATFLASTPNPDNYDYEEDKYLIATRILAYQLLHAPETRSRDPSIPFIVVVTDQVQEESRKRLRADGAIVVEVPGLSADWLSPDSSTWTHVMTKLRLWELVDFERIAFVDADTLLVEPLDDVFTDPAADEQMTGADKTKLKDGTTPTPSTFVFAGNAEHTHKHHFPPSENHRDWPNIDYLNAGLFVLKPDIQLLQHYISFLNIPNSFISSMPEQNLLNEIHARNGNMPWKQLNTTLNIHYPTYEDILNGAKSIHEKWWFGADKPTKLTMFMQSWRWRMEGYFEAADTILRP